MIAISDKLRHQVMKLAEQYEKPEFITDDPVQFPRRFGYKCSQEIVGFIAAWLAYGNRKAILSTCEKLCKEMEHLTPYMYIKNMGWRKYIDSEEPLYRFFKEKEFVDLDQRSIREISAFLRQFDRQNVKIDANPFDRKMLNEEIYQI